MGLAAVPGAVRYLEERKIGFDWGIRDVRVPIVVGAVIDDLALGDGTIRPDAESGYKACQAASSAPLQEGNVGVGAGATIGKMLVHQGLGGMRQSLEPRQPEETARPLDRVYRPKYIRQQLRTFGLVLQLCETPLHPVEPLFEGKWG